MELSVETSRAGRVTHDGARSRASRARTASRAAGLALLTLLLWSADYALSFGGAGIDVDSSWQRAQSYFFASGMRAGPDYVFTWGPLGWLATAAWHVPGFWIRALLWDGAFRLVTAAVVVRAWWRVPRVLDRALLVLLYLIVSPDYEVRIFVSVCAAAVVLCDRERVARGWFVAGAVVLAGFALVKFNYAVLGAACACAVAVELARRGQIARAFRWLALCAGLVLALWLAIGQSIADLPTYVARALDVARGYSTMGKALSGAQLALAGIVALCACATIALGVTSATRARTSGGGAPWPILALLAFALFLAFKGQFVRHAPGGSFFWFAALVPLFAAPVLGAPSSRLGRARSLALAASKLGWIASALLGVAAPSWSFAPFAEGFAEVLPQWNAQLDFLVHMPAARAALVAREERLARQFDLPRTRAVVGDAPIDVLSINQGILLLNGFDYRPRPVYQGYAANTAALVELNARAYEGERAPRFVLLRLVPLDDRMAAMEDAGALEALLRDFRPVHVERGFLLLERDPPPARARASRATLVERTVHFGERVEIGAASECRRLALDVRPTLLGRARTALLQEAEVRLSIVRASGLESDYRIVPELMRRGVLLDPLITGKEDAVRWFAGIEPQRVVAFTVEIDPSVRACYAPEIGVRVTAADDLWAPSARAPRPELVYAMFSRPPDEIVAEHGVYDELVWNREALVVGAPSSLRFALAPGAHRVAGRFGILNAALVRGKSQGVRFRIAQHASDGTRRTLFERALEPRELADDRGGKTFEVELDASATSDLLLETEALGTSLENSAYWCEVAIDTP